MVILSHSLYNIKLRVALMGKIKGTLYPFTIVSFWIHNEMGMESSGLS